MCPSSPSIDSGAADGSPVPERGRLSVIVPALDEEATLPGLLADLRAFSVPPEVVVADGGSGDATPEVAARGGARVLDAPRGRGVQLALAANSASGDWLLALHADVRLDGHARRAVERAIHSGEQAAFALRLAIDAGGVRYRLVELAANLRSRWLHLPYGDQGLLLPRTLYERAGGYPPLPLMEDVVLVRELRKLAPIRMLDAAILVSARRWARDGVLRRSLRNWRLMRDFNRGVHPSQLAPRYDGRASAPDLPANPRPDVRGAGPR